MSSVVVSGLVLPVAVGGHPALDFCNTRAGWGSPAPKEYLSSYDHLAVWTRESRRLPASRGRGVPPSGAGRSGGCPGRAGDGPRAAGRGIRRAARVTQQLGRLPSSRPTPAPLGQQRRCAARLPGCGRRCGGHSRWTAYARRCWASRPSWTTCSAPRCRASSRRALVSGCGWLFADPRLRRRWCDMAVCGNRAKARRHAERRAAARRAAP